MGMVRSPKSIAGAVGLALGPFHLLASLLSYLTIDQSCVSIPLISAHQGSLQGVSRRSPGRSRPREHGRSGLDTSPYVRTRQPEGWVREFSHTPNSFSVTTRHSAGGLGRRRRRQYVLRTSRPATLAPASEGSEGQAPG